MLGTSVQLMGVSDTLNELKSVQPELYKQMVEDIKTIVRPAETAIISNIPTVAPLSGMNHSGRSAWGPPKITTRVTPNAKAYVGTEARLVQIETTTAGKLYGIELADMAGRGTGRGRKPRPVTRQYSYKNGARSHRIDGNGVKNPNHVYKFRTQGQALIANLPGNKGSRYIYPAIERKFPQIQKQVLRVLDTAAAKINRKLERI